MKPHRSCSFLDLGQDRRITVDSSEAKVMEKWPLDSPPNGYIPSQTLIDRTVVAEAARCFEVGIVRSVRHRSKDLHRHLPELIGETAYGSGVSKDPELPLHKGSEVSEICIAYSQVRVLKCLNPFSRKAPPSGSFNQE